MDTPLNTDLGGLEETRVGLKVSGNQVAKRILALEQQADNFWGMMLDTGISDGHCKSYDPLTIEPVEDGEGYNFLSYVFDYDDGTRSRWFKTLDEGQVWLLKSFRQWLEDERLEELTEGNDLAASIPEATKQRTQNPPIKATQSDKELREKVVQARYSKFEKYDDLDSFEKSIIDAIMALIAEETNTARIDEIQKMQSELTYFAAQYTVPRIRFKGETDHATGLYQGQSEVTNNIFLKLRNRLASLKANKGKS